MAGERIDEADLAYHRKVVAGVREARRQLDAATAVGDAWCRHLAERYGLAAADVVDAEGAILRADAPPGGPPPARGE